MKNETAEEALTEEVEILIDTSQLPATFAISQQRGVIVDDAGNQEFFWLKLTVPFTVNGAIAPADESLKEQVRRQLAAPLGSLMLDLLHAHESRMAPVIQSGEIQEYAPNEFDEETF